MDDMENAATSALEAARATGDRDSAPLLRKRLDAYRNGRPWRQ